ncbi:kinase-like domain-containing protein [Podospora australis]|uniref:Kinase-like domain-containing protein n=1 Tax=Podospora australis TaxID=1536484 RepID=A0AAN7ABB9_9PEZI|nr:kinase-like domain-containing protein [Podospora australis]
MASPTSSDAIQVQIQRTLSGLVTENTDRVRKICDRGEEDFRKRQPQFFSRRAIEWPETIDNQIIWKTKTKLWHARATFLKNPEAGDVFFLPRGDFYRIFTPEVVLHIVIHLKCYMSESDERKRRLAQDIYFGESQRAPCHKLLAALILMDHREVVHHFASFIQHGMNDDCLPLKPTSGVLGGKLVCSHRDHCRDLIINRDTDEDSDESAREDFMKQCESLTAPYTIWSEDGKHCHYILDAKGPLPLKYIRSASVGGFGEVSCVQLADADRSFSAVSPSTFCISTRVEKPKPSPSAFDLELSSLLFAGSRASKEDEDRNTKRHLLEVFATYEIHDVLSNLTTYYFLFPWANGNLKEFWEAKRRWNTSLTTRQDDLEWMIEQFFWLAKALRLVHNDRDKTLSSRRIPSNSRYGRHGDIKPQNILYFEDRDGRRTLVLGDFGLGRVNSKHSRSLITPGGAGGTVTYQAPEFENTDPRISRKTDIFSLGCVFLEFVTWLLDGADALKVFGDQRMEPDARPAYAAFSMDTFYVSCTPPKLKDSVKNWIQNLLDHPDCAEVVENLLNLIEKMLEPDHGKRIGSQFLERELSKILKTWKVRDEYYIIRQHGKGECFRIKRTNRRSTKLTVI